MSDKGFMRLSEKELSLLEKSIEMIDLQQGCPNQCITCGVDAPRLQGHMSLEDYMTLSKSIEQVREERGIELIAGGHFYPYRASDPTYYPWLPEIVEDLVKRHEQLVTLTTAGWTPGNNHMQRNMEEIAGWGWEDSVHLGYSLKTVGALARADWDRWVEKQLSTLNNEVISENEELLEERLEDFFQESRHIQRTISNLRTIQKLNPIAEVQYVHLKEDLIPRHLRKYGLLFSKDCVEALYEYALRQDGVKIAHMNPRAFHGFGKAISELGMDLHSTPQETKKYIEEGLDPSLPHPSGDEFSRGEDTVSALIDSDGTLKIYSASPFIFGTESLPKEFFTARAAHASRIGQHEEWRKYKLLEGLQGRNLLE